jgi:uncharacterized protein
MRALLDVNVLLALMDRDNIHHRSALAWWRSDREHGWASCPLTQNGFVRISCQARYRGPRPIAHAVEQLRLQLSELSHEFWPDDVSIADAEVFDHSRILGPKQITDVYLLALAVKHEGRLATFDRTIPLAAVRGAEARHVAVI